KFKGYARPDLYLITDGTNVRFSMELEFLSGPSPLISKTGSTNVVAVAATLWDITDGPSTDDSTPGSDDDPLERPFSDVRKVITTYLPTLTTPGITLEDFWDGWFALGNGFASEMTTVFSSLNGIEYVADASEPDNTTALAPTVSVAPIALGSGGPNVL